ncbi:MAG TPA: hypothetical protein V6D22_09650 [Candidatus Obscuribacterales bacterium]
MSDEHINLPIQSARDERDLKALVLGHYILAAFFAILTAALVLMAGAAVFSPYLSGGWVTAASSLFAALGSALFAYANVHSGKAISAREDPQLSTYVAGLNTMACFPVGTFFGIYSWRVLSRPTVRDLYNAPLRGAPAIAKSAPSKPKAKDKIKLVTTPTPPAAEPMQFHEAMAYADEKEEAMWKKLEEEHRNSNPDGGK